jgi:phosphatidylinositol-3-phosphatase
MKKYILTLVICIILAACQPQNINAGMTQPESNPPATATQIPSATPVVEKQLPQATPLPPKVADAAPESKTSPTPTAQAAASGKIPNFDHIVLIVLENQDYQAIIGNSGMPNLNDLAKKYVLLSSYYAVRHPSLPNYIALMSGDTQNITSDCRDCFVNQTNLADLIEASGRTWKAYQEDMPSACFLGDSNPYVQKHDPLIYFDSVRLNQARCDRSIVPLTQLEKDLSANQLPAFAFIMPNLCNSGHDCGLEKADTWVKDMVAKLQASPAFGGNTLIAVVFDEASSKNTGSCCGMGNKAGGQVAAILISPQAKPGFTDDTQYSHYSLLKTILTAWGLPALGKTQDAATLPITAPWQ